MMLFMHLAFSIGLLALAAGTALYVWAVRSQGKGTGLAKFFGILIILFALISEVCIVYTSARFMTMMWGGPRMGLGMPMQPMNQPNMQGQQAMPMAPMPPNEMKHQGKQGMQNKTKKMNDENT